MSKNKINDSNVPSASFGYAYCIGESSIQYLQGRILTLIEAMGLPQSQEKSVKDLLSKEIWDIINPDSGTIYLPESINDEIHRLYFEEKEEYRKNGSNLPMSVFGWGNKYKLTRL